jgi:Na+/proline symporter
MTVTFILSMALGVASSIEGRNPLLEGFGMIALVALAPILSVLILGLLFKRKERENVPKTTG